MITFQIDRDKDLEIFVLTGELVVNDVMTALAEAHAKGPCKYSLWETHDAKLISMSSSDIKMAVRYVARHGQVPEGAKAAIVASGEMEYLVARVGEMLGELEDSPYELEVFKDRESALSWLGFGPE